MQPHKFSMFKRGPMARTSWVANPQIPQWGFATVALLQKGSIALMNSAIAIFPTLLVGSIHPLTMRPTCQWVVNCHHGDALKVGALKLSHLIGFTTYTLELVVTLLLLAFGYSFERACMTISISMTQMTSWAVSTWRWLTSANNMGTLANHYFWEGIGFQVLTPLLPKALPLWFPCHALLALRFSLPSKPVMSVSNLGGKGDYAELGSKFKGCHVKLLIFWTALQAQEFADAHPSDSWITNDTHTWMHDA